MFRHVSGYSFYDAPLNSAENIPSNSRVWRGFTVQPVVRYFLDGCNTGLYAFVIHESQLDNFRNGRGFEYFYGTPTTSSPSTADPGNRELRLSPGVYYLAFYNRDTVSKAVTYQLECWTSGGTPPPRADYKAVLDFTNAEGKKTNLLGYLAVLDADGGAQRGVIRMNEIDTTYRKSAPFSLKEDSTVVFRVKNDSYRVHHTVRILPAEQ